MPCILDENTVPLKADVVYSDSLNGLSDIDTYSFSMIENETMTFYITFNATSPDATLKLYRFEGSEIISLGTSYLRQANNTFIYDGIVGDYYFCLENTFPVDYTLRVNFTDYDGIIFHNVQCYSGEIGEATIPEFIAGPCTLAVAYEHRQGKLPDELIFHSNGFITGIALEQDCESRLDETPSWNWKRVDAETGERYPIAKEYPFQVRAYLDKYPQMYMDRWFKICVHNNWDLDPPNIDNLSKTIYTVHEITELVETSPLCPPCEVTNTYTTEEIINFKGYEDVTSDERMKLLMYEKICLGRHILPEIHDNYIPIVVEEEKPELCPPCGPKDVNAVTLTTEDKVLCPVC